MTNVPHEPERLTGRTAIDPSGDKIGTIAGVYVDDDTSEAEWLAISTGRFGTRVSVAPLRGAEFAGDDVVVPYPKSLVKNAPKAEADGHLSAQEEAELHAYYGRSPGNDGSEPGDGGGGEYGGSQLDWSRHTTGANTDDAMMRSGEELDVQKRSRETGRARLRKWIKTEDVEVRVPVQREKARVVTGPITDANREDAISDDDLTDAVHEVVLRQEVVEVDKRVVPKERVRLDTEVESDEVAVHDEVRKERIDMGDDTRRS